MEMLDAKKKLDIEAAKIRLDETRQKLSETMARITRAEKELQDLRLQNDKKRKNLNRIEGTQFFKISKLNNDIRNLENGLQTRLEEEDELKKMNAQLSADLKKCTEDDVNMEEEFQKMFKDLEEKITSGYAQIQSQKDAEVMIEVGLSTFKPDEHAPFMEDFLAKRMGEDRTDKADLSALDVALNEIDKQIHIRMEELTQLKAANSILCNQITEMTGQ